MASIYQVNEWFTIFIMLAIAILSIKAYRRSLKKVFFLFLVASSFYSLHGIYSKFYSHLLKNPLAPISKSILKLMRDDTPLSAQDMHLREEKSAAWTEALAKQKMIDEKYPDAKNPERTRQTKYNFIQALKIITRGWMLPLGILIVCMNEIKVSNQRVQSISGSARSE